ncbi:MAG TPA: serine protease [Gemmatimonadales bacterium]|jgi:serine protease Do|nr:serine protease [Gemmatimonadales bacterium]
MNASATAPAPGALAAVGEELAATVDALRRVTVQVRTRGPGIGAGVVWGGDGLVITNAHVARGDRVRVDLWDGTVAEARVFARDRERDLAALRCDRAPLPGGAVLGDSRQLRAGDLVIAVGHPNGDVGAATVGVIHVVDAPADGPPRWICADLRLAPGYSGGPLADAGGRVVGINTMIHGGLALAVPASAVEAFLARAAGQSVSAAPRPGRRAPVAPGARIQGRRR